MAEETNETVEETTTDDTLKVRPYGNKVLVERIKHEKKGSIIIHGNNSADGRFVKGVIKAVGDPIPNLAGLLLSPNLHVGEVILYNFHCATPVAIPNGKTYDAVPYHEVLAIFTDEVQIISDEELIPSTARASAGSFH